MNIAAYLRNTDFFKGVSDAGMTALADICSPIELDKKQELFAEGEKGASIYLCIKGNVQLYKSAKDGRDVVIKVAKSGDLFGEVILFEKDTYPVSARAISSATLICIPRNRFLNLLDDPKFRNDFFASLMVKLRYLTDQIRHLTLHDVEQRFFMFLRDHYGEVEELELTVSKKDLALSIATTPESLSRLFERLTSDRTLFMDGKKIRLARGFWEKKHYGS